MCTIVKMVPASYIHDRQIEALDRTTAMGSVTFHIHGETRPGGLIPNNVLMYTSTNFLNNPAAAIALAKMKDIFTDEVAVGFGDDWLNRAVNAKYLSANVLSPTPSPIKATSANQRHYASSTYSTNAARERSPSPTATAISSVSSLTESALADHNSDDTPAAMPTHRHKRPALHLATSLAQSNSRDGDSQPSPLRTAPPVIVNSPPLLTLLSTVTLSASALPRGTISRTVGSPLSGDVEDFMSAVGRGNDEHREVLREIYQLTGRALWVDEVMTKLNLAEGMAKALVGLMLNII